MSSDRPKKLQRTSQACDLCHRRSIRCRPSVENAQKQCQNCFDFAVPCTYRRPSRRRRSQIAAGSTPTAIHDDPQQQQQQQQRKRPSSPVIDAHATTEGTSQSHSDAGIPTTDFRRSTISYEPPPPLPPPPPPPPLSAGGWHDPVDVGWRSFAVASAHTINVYLDTYMSVVYPLLPLFHGPTLWGQIQHRYHLAHRGFFASIMAACALAVARTRDGAAVHTTHRSGLDPGELVAVFVHAAKEAVFKDHDRGVGVEYIRACALLAVTSIQLGQIREMHQYLGRCMTLSAMQQFHNEAAWPATLSIIEREEWRRLFWSIYNLDIYASAVFDGMPRSQELYTNVAYPSSGGNDAWLVDDVEEENEKRWLRGWNFVTDLHRVLDHAMQRLRWQRRGTTEEAMVDQFFKPDAIPEGQVVDSILKLYHELPDPVKDFTISITTNLQSNMCSLQAINIQATLQLVRIVLLGSSGAGDDHAKCEVVEQVVWAFQSMALSSLRVVSTPLVYNLGAIGHMLATAMQEVVAEDVLLRARKSLESLTGFLTRLESGLQAPCSASERLRTQIMALDQHIQTQRPISPLKNASEVGGLAARGSRISVEAPMGPTAAMSYPINAKDTLTPSDDLLSICEDWSWPFDLAQGATQDSPSTGYGRHS